MLAHSVQSYPSLLDHLRATGALEGMNSSPSNPSNPSIPNFTEDELLKMSPEDFNKVFSQFETMLQTTVNENENLRKKVKELEEENLKLAHERDTATDDLSGVESAFSDLLRKYERCKGVLENAKKNEELLVRRDKEMQYKMNSSEAKLNDIKSKVTNKLECAHSDYDARIKDLQTDAAKLRAQLRKSEMKVEHLEKDLAQKTSEVERLSKYCDELIDRNVHH